MRTADRCGSTLRMTAGALVVLGLTACAGDGSDGTATSQARDLSPGDMRLADATLAAGAPGIALHVLDERLRQNPHDTAALTRRGQALAALGRPADAAQSFASALKQDPGNFTALTGLASARAATGDAAAAEAAWRAALAVQPNDARVRVGLAIALDLQGRHDDAQALYRAVLAQAPDDAVASADLGLSLALSGHASDALPLLEHASQGGFGADHAGADIRARHNLAVGLVMAGQDGQARQVLSQDLSPDAVNAALTGLRQFAAAP